MNNDNRRQAERNQARLDCRGAKEEAKGKMELRYSEDEVNWDELAGIGILKDELEQAGELMSRRGSL